jgi:DNA-binding GntR family transcriptional regulator
MTHAQGRPPPKYRQIAEALRAQIAAGEFPVGAQLPSIGELREEYDAAKGTVDEALAVLRELGLVETRHGAGSFVIAVQPGESETQQLSEQVASLRAQVAELRKRVEADSDLREMVNRIEDNLIELYGKTAFNYPHPEYGADGGERRDRTARHG